MVVQASSTGRRLVVTADGRGLEGRAGAGLLRAAADRLGLTAALRGAVDGVRSWETHPPGAVARDLAVMLADGGTCVSDIATLRRGHDALFATVASQPTATRPSTREPSLHRSISSFTDGSGSRLCAYWIC